jgi:hypothetical protein
MTKTVYQVQGKEYADEPAATAALAAVIGEPVRHVDWLEITSFRDEANGVQRFIAGMVNHRIEPGDSDFEAFLQKYRKPLAPPDELDIPTGDEPDVPTGTAGDEGG